METLTEIQSAENTRRQKAAQFEHLDRQRTSLTEKVARLETIIKSLDPAPLEQILELATKVDRGLTSHSSFGTHGGVEVATEIQRLAAGGLRDLRYKVQKHQAELDAARAKLANVEEGLKGLS